jgi:hypothetical protein
MNIQRFRTAVAGVCLAALAACSGGGSDMASNSGGGPTPPSLSNGTGTALIALTDAPGDFLTYGVSVASIELQRADGTLVETLPASTQVDFAQLVDFSEILSASQVPAGIYVGATLTLDYADALLVVDNGAGGLQVPNGNIFNALTDTALTGENSQITLSVKLPAGKPLVITGSTVSHLSLDFDLAATKTVDPPQPGAGTLAGDLKVKVSPVLAADIVPDPTRDLRLRGTLVSVTNSPPGEMSYLVHVVPFHLRDDAAQGDVVVKTADTTVFSVNGVIRTGTQGLAALALLPAGSLTLAQGVFDLNTHTYTASYVLAGTSLPIAGSDFLQGTVIARSGNVLTVSGALTCVDYNDRNQIFTQSGNGRGLGHKKGNGNGHGNSNGNGHRKYDGSDDDGWRFEFNRVVLVTVGNGTVVTKAGGTGPVTTQDISVGQRIAVYGKLGQDSSGARTLDATAGGARMQVTGLWGTFVSQTGRVVLLDLQQLGDRRPAAFNFAGTGTSGNDANPAAYSVFVPPALPVAMPKAGSPQAGWPLRFFGFVAPFGAAPPAFNAVSLVNYASTAAQVELNWNSPGVTSPFVQINPAKLEVSQGTLQSAQTAALAIGPRVIDLSKSPLGVTFIPDPAATSGGFAIAHRKSVRIDTYDTFDRLVVALNTALNGTTALYRLHAQGPYDPGTGAVTTSRMFVVLND